MAMWCWRSLYGNTTPTINFGKGGLEGAISAQRRQANAFGIGDGERGDRLDPC
ncbi:MAG: hypothetical protein F6K65_42380 [Moorea sp. SIO3C2]|nr:hypothetical protein [Moorena sp. SIO3C2]